jgi:excisionase family DNA binding protein
MYSTDNLVVYTIHDVATIIKRNTQYVRQEIRIGNLKAKRVGRTLRIRKEWLETWLESDTPIANPMPVRTRELLAALN